MMRRRLIQLARELQEGQEPFAAAHGELFRLRSAGRSLASGLSFVEASDSHVRVHDLDAGNRPVVRCPASGNHPLAVSTPRRWRSNRRGASILLGEPIGQTTLTPPPHPRQPAEPGSAPLLYSLPVAARNKRLLHQDPPPRQAPARRASHKQAAHLTPSSTPRPAWTPSKCRILPWILSPAPQ